MKKLLAISMALIFAGLISCGEKVDEQELTDAENLVEGLALMGMMTNVETYTGSTLFGPPLGWTGPAIYNNVPSEWGNNYYYAFAWKFPLDSAGTVIDTLLWLVMLTPDIWDTLYQDSTVTKIDVGLLAETRNIWFHTIISFPDTMHISGDLKWNWESTWYKYAFNTSTVNESGEITITTSANINLSAHFKFDSLGAGGPEDNWGKYQETKFVQFTFFAQPDANGYDGYYELASEAWKVKHYFKLQKEHV